MSCGSIAEIELTILMPCLNEAETLATCIRKAKQFLRENGIDGEVLISDNGSNDGSQAIAVSEGARVVSTDIKGYGSALINGTKEAYGKYIIMGDADDSYDFLHLMPFVEKLREDYDLVMGNRFAGGIEDGAMPWSHRYIGNPVLSFIGRLFYSSSIRDFHCGLRGFNRASILNLNLQTTGMEFASEMVVKSELYGLRITEVPTTLCKDGRSRSPHLKSFRDGWRHLKFLLMYAPKWLLLYPCFAFMFIGLLFGVFYVSNMHSLNSHFSGILYLLACIASLIIGIDMFLMFLIVKSYSNYHGFLPRVDEKETIHEDLIIAIGGGLILLALIVSILAIKFGNTFNSLPDNSFERIIRLAMAAVFCFITGIQSVCTGFVIGIVKMKTEKN